VERSFTLSDGAVGEFALPEKKADVRDRLQRAGVIVANAELCLTCRECEVACSLYHEGECSPTLSRIRIEFDDFNPGLPTIVVCKQCDWPACYYACADRWEESAVRVDPVSGARYVDPELCRGCDACLRACPLTPERPVIGYRREGRKRIYFFCDLCMGRAEGPLCVQICPGEALQLVPAAERPR
jgi:carbon-monoxide dehydrogenase iron sulfur subunit